MPVSVIRVTGKIGVSHTAAAAAVVPGRKYQERLLLSTGKSHCIRIGLKIIGENPCHILFLLVQSIDVYPVVVPLRRQQ